MYVNFEILNAMAKKVAIKEDIKVNFITSSAEDIPFPNDYFDTVLITYTMCTIPSVLQANKEIILSSGAIGSPQILQVSGIGNSEKLKDLGIDTIQNE